MKYLLILLTASLLTACDGASPGPTGYGKDRTMSKDQYSKFIRNRAISSCISKGGIPLMNSYDRMINCKFPPK